MSEQWTINWAWWITAVEVPVLGCLFWMIHYGRREAEQALLKVYREIQGNLNVVLENLAPLEARGGASLCHDRRPQGRREAADRSSAAPGSPADLHLPERAA